MKIYWLCLNDAQIHYNVKPSKQTILLILNLAMTIA